MSWSREVQLYTAIGGVRFSEALRRAETNAAVSSPETLTDAEKLHWQSLGAVLDVQSIAGGIRFECERAAFDVVWRDDDRVEFHLLLENSPRELSTVETVRVIVTSTPEAITLRSPRLVVIVRRADLHVTVTLANGAEVSSFAAGIHWSAEGARLSLTLAPDEWCFGLGALDQPLHLRGRRGVTGWQRPQPISTVDGDKKRRFRITQPTYLGVRDASAYAIFLDENDLHSVDLGAAIPDELIVETASSHLHWSIAAGETIHTLWRHLPSAAFLRDLPPMWLLGYGHAQVGERDSFDLLSVIAHLRQRAIHLDTIYIDVTEEDADLMQSSLNDLIRRLKKYGVHVVACLPIGLRADSPTRIPLLRKSNARLATILHWSGERMLPDLITGSGRSLIRSEADRVLAAGAEGIALDTPGLAGDLPRAEVSISSLPVDAFGEGRNARAYAENYNGRLLEALDDPSSQNRRAFIQPLGLGTPRGVWFVSPEAPTFHALRRAISTCLNISLSGIHRVGVEITDFGDSPDAEIMTRWLQAVCLLPFLRGRVVRGRSLWTAQQPYATIQRMALALRHELTPYLYSLVAQGQQYGIPPLKPFFTAFTDDPMQRSIDDTYLIGDLLIAPILSTDAERSLLLPPGGWYEYQTNAYLNGGQPLVIKAALDALPLFVRAGVVLIVRDRNLQPVGQESNRLLIYAGDGETILYEDDGISLAYRAGRYRWVFISVRQDRDGQRVVINRRVAGNYTPSMPTFWVTVYGIPEMPTRVTIDRQHAPVWYFDNGALDLQVPDDFREITITREAAAEDRTLLRRPVLS